MQNNKEQFKLEKSMHFKDCYCTKKNCDVGTFLPKSVDHTTQVSKGREAETSWGIGGQAWELFKDQEWTSLVAQWLILHLSESACNVGHPSSIPGSGRSAGEGNGHPLQYSCLENSMDRGAWWATVHGVTKSQTRLNN